MYRVAAKLGSGGMGIVYRAYDEKLQRDVAIKLLHRGPDDSGRERILHEARTSSALNHPGICTVYEVDDHGDQSFIVMELVDGRPLSDLIPRTDSHSSRCKPMGCRSRTPSPTHTPEASSIAT